MSALRMGTVAAPIILTNSTLQCLPAAKQPAATLSKGTHVRSHALKPIPFKCCFTFVLRGGLKASDTHETAHICAPQPTPPEKPHATTTNGQHQQLHSDSDHSRHANTPHPTTRTQTARPPDHHHVTTGQRGRQAKPLCKQPANSSCLLRPVEPDGLDGVIGIQQLSR